MDLRRTFALVLIAGSLSFGQALATLTGIVTDPSAAVLPEATITARNVANGTIFSSRSSATGNYTITNLPIGPYEVVIEKEGFKVFRRDGITLSAAQSLRVDAQMEIGAATESVTVTGAASLMKTESGTLVHNITPQDIQTLPLLTVGTFARDPFAMVQTLPGVVFASNGFTRVNGLSTDQIQYRLEGEVMGESGGLAWITTRTQPSPDALEEVAVQTSNFNAEFGSVGGAVYNMRIKSGTNQYHGTVYDYMVNEALNANNPGTQSKNRVRRHDYGFNIGGPIKIPGVYDGSNRSFFFFNWEQYRDRQLQRTFTAPTVPLEAYRNGDFSQLIGLSGNRNLTIGTGAAQRNYLDPLGNTILAGTIFDPASTQQVTCNPSVSPDCGTAGNVVRYRTPLVGNRLRASDLDSVATTIQDKYIPLPLGPNASNPINNFFNPFETTRRTNMPSIKIDQNITSTARLSFSYQQTKTSSPVQALGNLERGFQSVISTNAGTFEDAPTYRLNYDQTLTPTVQLHIGAGWTQFNFNTNAQNVNYDPVADLGLRGATVARNFPRFDSSVTTTPVALGGMDVMGPGGQTTSGERRPSGTVNLTWVKNNHTIKGGADWRLAMLPTQTFTNTAGNYGGFNGNGITWQPALLGVTGLSGNSNTGFGYANFLLGSVRSVTLAQPIAYRNSKQQWGTFLQDTWRATRNLTIDIGLRWDLGTYTREDRGRNASLSLTEPNPSAGGRLGALIFEQTCNCNFADNYPYAIGPRLGVSYTLNPKTVIRGGLGLSYGSTAVFGGFTANSATGPSLVDGDDFFKLRDGIPSSVNPQWPNFSANLGQAVGAVVGAQQLLDPNAGRPSRILQWNFSLQREITRNFVIEASYVGNRGHWLTATGRQDLNAVGEDLLAKYGFEVGNLNDATLLTQRLDRLTSAQRATLTSRGVVLPYSNFPQAQIVRQSIRPFPQYSNAISPANAPLGRTWYDSFQLTMNKRYSHGLMVNANYTYSKNLTATTLADVFNPNYANKDLVGANPPQQLRVSFEYQVPRPASYIPVLGNRWVSQAIGGWGVSMSLFYQTAPYIGRPATSTTNAISQWLGRGPGSAQLKRDADGNYMNPWSVNWTDYDGNLRTDPIDINCRCFDPEKTIVLNPAAWESIPAAQWADQAQIIPTYRGIRRPTESANFARNFKFGRDGRVTLQVRVEVQNMFNRLLLPTTPLSAFQNFNNVPVPTADGRYTTGFGTFGNLRTANSFGPSRSGLLIGRLSF